MAGPVSHPRTPVPIGSADSSGRAPGQARKRFRAVSNGVGARLNGSDSSNVQSDRGVEFERITTACDLRASKHHTDLHSKLIDEQHGRMGFVDCCGELPHRLTHEARLSARGDISHVSI